MEGVKGVAREERGVVGEGLLGLEDSHYPLS